MFGHLGAVVGNALERTTLGGPAHGRRASRTDLAGEFGMSAFMRAANGHAPDPLQDVFPLPVLSRITTAVGTPDGIAYAAALASNQAYQKRALPWFTDKEGRYWQLCEGHELHCAYKTDDYMVVAFRGTASAMDIEPDLRIALGSDAHLRRHPRYKVSRRFARNCRDSYQQARKLILTGHSLGGTFAFLVSNSQRDVGTCVVHLFNPGAGPTDYETLTEVSGYNSAATIFVHKMLGDPVCVCFPEPKNGEVIWYAPKSPLQRAHSLENFLLEKDKSKALMTRGYLTDPYVPATAEHLSSRVQNVVAATTNEILEDDVVVNVISAVMGLCMMLCIYLQDASVLTIVGVLVLILSFISMAALRFSKPLQRLLEPMHLWHTNTIGPIVLSLPVMYVYGRHAAWDPMRILWDFLRGMSSLWILVAVAKYRIQELLQGGSHPLVKVLFQPMIWVLTLVYFNDHLFLHFGVHPFAILYILPNFVGWAEAWLGSHGAAVTQTIFRSVSSMRETAAVLHVALVSSYRERRALMVLVGKIMVFAGKVLDCWAWKSALLLPQRALILWALHLVLVAQKVVYAGQGFWASADRHRKSRSWLSLMVLIDAAIVIVVATVLTLSVVFALIGFVPFVATVVTPFCFGLWSVLRS